MMKINQLAALGLGALILGCQSTPYGFGHASQETVSSMLAAQSQTPELSGHVDFPVGQRTQATAAQVLNQATVSLIDTNSGTTVSSGVTDGSGNFTLNFGAFSPAPNGTYLLEASKGLNAQLPGNIAPRFRTIVQYMAAGSIAGAPGWLSITNSTLPGTIAINSWTTAVAVESGLDPTNVAPANTIGKVNGGNGLNASPTYVNHADTEITNLRSDVVSYLTNNLDPVSTANSIAPKVNSIAPSSGNAYTLVTVNGSGFSPIAGGTTVTIGGVNCPVMMSNPSQMIVQVPLGAVSGNLVVSTARGGNSNATTFSVPNGSAVAISDLSPNPVALPGGTITLNGWGYSTTPANDNVTFTTASGTTSAVPTSASPTTLVVPVPGTAVSGVVTVSVGGQTSNGFFLTVQPIPAIASIFPTSATHYGDFYIYGSNLGTVAGTVQVGGNTATIKKWRNDYILANVAFTTPAGSQNVIVTTSANQVAAAAQTLTVLTGNSIGSFANIGTVTNSGTCIAPAWNQKNLFLAGGGTGTAITRIPVNSDGSLNLAGAVAAGNVPYAIGANDLGSHFFGWAGNRFWYAANNSTSKGFLAFDDDTGTLLSANDAGYGNMGPGVGDSGCTSTTKALYLISGGDSGGAATTAAYALTSPDGSLGAWVNVNNHPNIVGDQHAIVVGNQLWSVGAAGTFWVPLNTDGSIQNVAWTQVSTCSFSDPGQAANHTGALTQVGDWVYSFGTWANGTQIRRAQVSGGSWNVGPGAMSPLLANPSGANFGGAASALVIGGYVYVFGGLNANTNVVWQAPITN